MNALDLLFDRHSTPAKHLCAPPPDDTQLDIMLRAAMSAPDHAALVPWRFLIVREPALPALGELWATAYASRHPHAEPELVQRQREKIQRAPLLIGIISHLSENHPRVPELEQHLAVAVAAGHILLAAQALGYGTIWLSGESCRDRHVSHALGLSENEHLLGFINTGSIKGNPPLRTRQDPWPYTREWMG